MVDSLKIRAICTFGVGTSVMLVNNIKKVLGKYNVKADVDAVTLIEAEGLQCDIAITEPSFQYLLNKIKCRKAITLSNFSNLNELEEKLLATLKELGVLA